MKQAEAFITDTWPYIMLAGLMVGCLLFAIAWAWLRVVHYRRAMHKAQAKQLRMELRMAALDELKQNVTT